MPQKRHSQAVRYAQLSSLSYAAGYRVQGDEHYEALLSALVDAQATVVWTAAEPEPLRPAVDESAHDRTAD